MSVGQEVASKLAELGISAASRALDPWPSMTPETGEAIVASLGGALRPVAHASVWVVRAAAPPSVLAGPAEWRWESDAYPIGEKPRIRYGEIAQGLARVIEAWRAREDEVGLLESALALATSLPEPRGGLRVSPSAREVVIGVERGRLRWPHFAYVRELDDCIEIVQSGPSDDARLRVKTRADLRAAIATLSPRSRLLEAFAEKFVAEKTAIERHAARLCEELAALPKRGREFHVRQSVVEMFGAKDQPVAWIDATSGAFRVTAKTTASEIATQSLAACPLREGYRYRAKQAFRGLDVGDVITLEKDEDIRPNDTRLLTFDKLILSETEDAWVLDRIGEWLEWIDE